MTLKKIVMPLTSKASTLKFLKDEEIEALERPMSIKIFI